MTSFSDSYAGRQPRSGRNNYFPPPPSSGDHIRRPPRYPTDPTRYARPAPCPTCGRGPSPVRYAALTSQLPGPKPPNQPDVSNLSDVVNKLDELEIAENTGINFDAYEDIPVEASGSDIPKPAATFADIELGEALRDNIVQSKYVKPTPIQRHAIPVALAGRDLMACAQTGSGKTAAFCFPIISGLMKNKLLEPVAVRGGNTLASPLALILSPTRELSCQIHDEAKKFSQRTGVEVGIAFGGASITQQLRTLEKGVDILVATPGRLVDMIERSRVSLGKIKYLALDEADRMLDMGFEPQIRKIVERMGMPATGVRQTMLFSATFPTDIHRLASDFLSNYVFLSVGRVGSSTDLIAQKVELVQGTVKRNYLMNLLLQQRENGLHGKNALTLVFVETKRRADSLEQCLCRNGFLATAIHGDKVQYERERSMRSFKSGATPIMVATDVASRGLDIPHVGHIINYDLPKSIDVYVHRIGRTGRAGKSGLATAFFSETENMGIAKPLAELMQEAKQEVPPWLAQYADRSEFGSGQRYGGRSKFGGQDYRNFNASSNVYGNESDCNSFPSSVTADYSGTANAAAAAAGCSAFAAANVNNYYSGGSREYEAIVPSGWD